MDLPINSMVIFHSYVNVYQRVLMIGCEMDPFLELVPLISLIHPDVTQNQGFK